MPEALRGSRDLPRHHRPTCYLTNMRASGAASPPPSPSASAAGDGAWRRRWARSGSASTTPWPRASSPPSNASCPTARTSTTPGQAGGRLITKRAEPSSSSSRDGITLIVVTKASESAPQAGEENPRSGYERFAHSEPTHAIRQRQLRDEVKSGGSQPTDIRGTHRRESCLPRPDSSTLRETASRDDTVA